MILCSRKGVVPSSHIDVAPNFQNGKIIMPSTNIPFPSYTRTTFAQITAIGFTGSIASAVVQLPTHSDIHKNLSARIQDAARTIHLLPFSGHTETVLDTTIRAVIDWMSNHELNINSLAVILSLCRTHYKYRKVILVRTKDDFLSGRFIRSDEMDYDDITRSARSFSVLLDSTENRNGDGNSITDMVLQMREVARLYEAGQDLDFGLVYGRDEIVVSALYDFPTISFDRRRVWDEDESSQADVIDNDNGAPVSASPFSGVHASKKVMGSNLKIASEGDAIFMFGPWSSLREIALYDRETAKKVHEYSSIALSTLKELDSSNTVESFRYGILHNVHHLLHKLTEITVMPCGSS